MSVIALRSGVSGVLFGGALTVAGMFSPAVIIGQLRLQNFHMLKTFLTASASSAIAIILAQRLNFTSCKPRLPNSIGLFSKYDGNIIGGALLGFGLALTGACPGTVLPQVATGVPSGSLVLIGGLLGGIIYSRYGEGLQRTVFTKKELDNPTVYEAVGIGKERGILLFESLCLSVIGTFNFFYPDSGSLLIPAASGGILIGLSQGASLVLTGNTLGISGAYEQLGDVFWWAETSLFEPSKKKPAPKIAQNLLFATGTIVGSFAISKVLDLPPPIPVEISALKAISGGAIMIFGSRLAGGCTSGHGISGMSQLSISSIVTVAAMFGAGVGLTAFL